MKKEINQYGDVSYFNEQNQLHRENGPAVECTNGDKFWYQNGKCHRENGPALEFADGDKQWWINDHLHREDGPAVLTNDGYLYWWYNELVLVNTAKRFTQKYFKPLKKIKIFL